MLISCNDSSPRGGCSHPRSCTSAEGPTSEHTTSHRGSPRMGEGAGIQRQAAHTHLSLLPLSPHSVSPHTLLACGDLRCRQGFQGKWKEGGHWGCQSRNSMSALRLQACQTHRQGGGGREDTDFFLLEFPHSTPGICPSLKRSH